jgi:hypothetical protein
MHGNARIFSLTANIFALQAFVNSTLCAASNSAILRRQPPSAETYRRPMSGLTADFKAATRHLIAQSLYALAAIVTLSLAVGANVLMLDTVDRLLLRSPAQVADPDRLVRFYFTIGDSFMSMTFPAVREDFARELTAFVERTRRSRRDRPAATGGARCWHESAVCFGVAAQ